MYSIKEHIYEISLNGVTRRDVLLHRWLWIPHHAIVLFENLFARAPLMTLVLLVRTDVIITEEIDLLLLSLLEEEIIRLSIF